MLSKKFSERGFMMLNVIFLTLIVSFTALIFLNGAAKVKNSGAELRFVALNLANEQFAEIESLAAQGKLSVGSKNFLGAEEDLKNFGLYRDEDLKTKTPVIFSVTSTVKNFSGYENLFEVTVKVTWTFEGKDFEVELNKVVRKNFLSEGD